MADDAEPFPALDAILLGAQSGAKLAITGIINAAREQERERLEGEIDRLMTAVETLTAQNAQLRAQMHALNEKRITPREKS